MPEGPTPADGLRIGGTAQLLPLDAARATAWIDDLRRRADEDGCARLSALLAVPGADRDRLGAVLDLSGHLNAILLARPDWLEQLFDGDALEFIDQVRRIDAVNDGFFVRLDGHGEPPHAGAGAPDRYTPEHSGTMPAVHTLPWIL